MSEPNEAAAATRTFLKAHAPFDRMDAADLDFAAAQMRPIAFRAGEAVTDPDAGPARWFYVLRRGRVVAEDQGEDERVSGNAWELVEGESFPVGALVDQRPVRNVQRAETEVVCLAMDYAAFTALRNRSAVFEEFCTKRLSALIAQKHKEVREEAAHDLGDSSLNVALSERPMRAPVTATPETTIRAALEAMSTHRIGSMVVTGPDQRPVGIFTLKDLLNRVALPGVALDAPLAAVMTPAPVTVPHTAFAFEAAMAMAHAGIQHICVVEDGRLRGVVSERDLFSMQRVGLVNLSRSIAAAGSVPDLARLAGDIRQLVAQMIAQGVKVGQITQIITLLNDRITVRVIELELAEAGGAPFPFTWLAFGSEGRQEQTMKTDQDNGILFVPPEGSDIETCRTRLLSLADRINRALDAVGFPLCTGNVMARNPDCCLTEAEWRGRFARWIDQGTPENLLNASIFFDFRPIWGPAGEAAALRRWLLDRVLGNGLFRRHMAANALRNAPPLGLVRDFRLSGAGSEANTIDLKMSGVTMFIDAARILALGAGVAATNTVERLEGAVAAGKLDRDDAATWIEAYDYIRALRMRLNEEQARAGGALSNRVDPSRLNDLDRRILKEAFREARRIQTRLTVDYQL